VFPNYNKTVALNLFLAILRVGLSTISAPLLIRSVGLTGILNLYYAATALSTSLFSVAVVPVEIHYSPIIASALKVDDSASLRHIVEKKIGASVLLLAPLFATVLIYQALAANVGYTYIAVHQAWIYIACLTNAWNQYQFSQLVAIMRLEKRQLSASYCSVLNILASSIFPLLIIPSHGLIGYILLSTLLTTFLNFILFASERLDAKRIVDYRPSKCFWRAYLKLFRLSFFTKSFAIVESVAVSIFALKDSALYFLAKKVTSQVLSVVIEGRIRFFESDIVHAIGNKDKLSVCSVLKANSRISSFVLIFYLISLAFAASSASWIGYLMHITVNQVYIALWISVLLSVWLYSSVTGVVQSCAFYSLGLAMENSLCLVYSAIAWSLIALIATFTFSIYGAAISLSAYFITNNVLMSRKVALALAQPLLPD
jgi:hypothetical protein